MLRILSHQIADGPTLMATDEALLAAAEYSTLRTYAWSEPTCSLGYFQDYASVAASFDHRLPMVRRITGGGAILHDHEVTYCLVANRGTEVPQRSQDIFAGLHQSISSELAKLGVHCELNQNQQGDKHYQSDVRCFASPAVNDIMRGEAKLLGSAARGFEQRILLHGSLKIDSNPWDADQVAGCGLSSDEAQALLIRSITQFLGQEYEHGSLSAYEQNIIERYKQQRYANNDWLIERKGPRACSLVK